MTSGSSRDRVAIQYRFSRDHVWALEIDGRYRIGLTDFAQQELGEISFIELPAVGTRVTVGDPVCAIDSLKSSSELYAPFAGVVTAVNSLLEQEGGPKKINDDPDGEGWILEMSADSDGDFEALMDSEEYRDYIGA